MAQVFNTITRHYPSKIALKYLNKEIKSPRGLQRGHLRNEWWEKNLNDYNLIWNSAVEYAKNKERWNHFYKKYKQTCPKGFESKNYLVLLIQEVTL